MGVVLPSVHLEALQLVPLLGQGRVQVQVAPIVGQLEGAVIKLGTERRLFDYLLITEGSPVTGREGLD